MGQKEETAKSGKEVEKEVKKKAEEEVEKDAQGPLKVKKKKPLLNLNIILFESR